MREVSYFEYEKNIDVIQKSINLSVAIWPGKCHQISAAILYYGDGKSLLVPEGTKLRYGHYYGPIATGSRFENRKGVFARHGWLQLPDGKIYDPTRWEFEQVEPYIYVEHDWNNEYDAGGNKLLALTHTQKPPQFNANDHIVEVKFPEDTLFYLNTIGLTPFQDQYSIGQMFWLANAPLKVLGSYATDIYITLNINDLKALIPIDNWGLVMEE